MWIPRAKSMEKNSGNGMRQRSVLRYLCTICCDFRFLCTRSETDEKWVHINVYQSNRNQTNNSSPQRNIAKYYRTNHNVPMMIMMKMMGEGESNIFWLKFNQFPAQFDTK